MDDIQKRLKSMVASALASEMEMLSDSRFLACVAAMTALNDGELNGYIARRMERIAVVLQAGEEMGS